MGKRLTLREEALSLAEQYDDLTMFFWDEEDNIQQVVKLKKEWGHEYVIYLTDNRMLSIFSYADHEDISYFMSRRF